ncbi:MAG: ABC transporter ATP-binding protein [Proteobacteria bacterium]|nr:ABC transporter ATP-binding protein [Pseudomonadota bacterium]MDA0861783.1 ABC transporter ATP-binding protein [Pseudomonadota bacterium]MDA1029889.1 ABC transporter ATP-binding protein [Pseudomonadota bacterium]
MPLIQFKNITKTYGTGENPFPALKGLNLSIDESEFIALMGPSGSGKSTTMNIAACLDTATSGTYLFQNVAVDKLDTHQRTLLRRNFLGFIFQGFNLLPRSSALENVELPLIYRGDSKKQRRSAAYEALEKVGLSDWKDHNPNELSGGQQQRVAIARAIVTSPKILLADEPTGNLDSQTSLEIMSLLTSLNRDSGVTIIMVTHEQEMAEYASRVVQFLDGQIRN